VVGPKSALGKSEIALNDLNWIGPPLSGPLAVQVRVRSSQELRPATVERGEEGAVVRFVEPELGVSPGQACVIYDGARGIRVLGGGFIRQL
jgi:tRNA-specific 2-thiouridylase